MRIVFEVLLILAASIVPYRAYKTQDGDILLGGGNDRLFGIICDRLGHPEWKIDTRCITNSIRVANRETVDALIQEVLSTEPTQHWLDVFGGSGLPYAAINDIQRTMNHDHVLARGMVKEMEHEWCGSIKMVNTPVKYSESKPGIRSAPPVLGQHTDQILRDVLGFNKMDIADLKKEGVIR